MDPEGPRDLSDLCLDQVCCSLDVLCSKQADGTMCLSWATQFPQEIIDRLLCKMAAKGILNDATVGIFQNSQEVRLRRVSIRSSPISAEAFLRAICPHRLQELDASWVSSGLTGANIVSGLASNPECRSSLQKLSLKGLCLDWGSLGQDGGSHVGFSSLQGLQVLNLANTDLSDPVLGDVCSLPKLEILDISCSNISNLTPLLECKNTLRSLIAHRLQKLDMCPDSLLFVLSHLQALRHLDFSEDHKCVDDSNRKDGDETMQQLLEGSPQVLPSLISLDISGRKGITEAAISAFVEARGGLVFLGLLATEVSSCDVLSSQKNLKVTGKANEMQVCEALRVYRDRECFTREALIQLHNLLIGVDKPRPELLQLVVSAMQNYPTSLYVHLAATACVYDLTMDNLAKAMSISLLSATAKQLLHAMKTFPNHQALQKNCLMAFSNDHILADVPFDTYLAVTLMLTWLSNYEDSNLERFVVSVIELLMYQLSYDEIVAFVTETTIMKQFLDIVKHKATLEVIDPTLDFALECLLHLIDLIPPAAQNFIDCQGLDLYEKVLDVYYGEAPMQKNAVFVLVKIAEEEALQANMMREDLMDHMLDLLEDPEKEIEMEVRFGAAGVLAHLVSRPEAWTLGEVLRSDVLQLLDETIITWTVQEKEISTYESFQPFCPLLQTSQPSGVQLWAVWAIHQACSVDTSRYRLMLEEEGVNELLKAVVGHPDTHSEVKRLSDSILCLVEQHQNP